MCKGLPVLVPSQDGGSMLCWDIIITVTQVTPRGTCGIWEPTTHPALMTGASSGLLICSPAGRLQGPRNQLYVLLSRGD